MKITSRIALLAVAAPLTIWVVTKLVTPTTTARAQDATPPVFLLNGNFSQAEEDTELPAQWTGQLDLNTRARISLQTEGARSAPAALSIAIESGTARIQQPLQGLPTKIIVLSGYAKAPAADQTVQGVLQVFDAESEAPIQTLTIPIEQSSEWKEFSQRLLLSPSATRATLIFEVHGKGEVLLDDISITPATTTDAPPFNDPQLPQQ